MLEPLVSRLVLGGDGHGTALLRSASTRSERAQVRVAGTGAGARRRPTTDAAGSSASSIELAAGRSRVTVPAGGFALVRR